MVQLMRAVVRLGWFIRHSSSHVLYCVHLLVGMDGRLLCFNYLRRRNGLLCQASYGLSYYYWT